MKPKTVEAIYTGGNIWLFFGRLEDDNWFMADDNGSVRIVNADPMFDLDVSLMEDWQLQHMVKDLFDRERQQFCSDMLDRLEQYEYGSDNNGVVSHRMRLKHTENTSERRYEHGKHRQTREVSRKA